MGRSTRNPCKHTDNNYSKVVSKVHRKPISNCTYLEVDDHSEDENGCHQVEKVGEILSVESFTESTNFVLSGGQKMEQCNHSSFELSSTAGVNCGRAEGLPHDRFTDIGGNEE